MRITLEVVRVAFPKFFKAEAVNGGAPKFGGLFILEAGHKSTAKIEAAMADVAKAKWGKDAASILKALKAGGKVCFRSGDDKAQYEGFEGNMYISTNSDKRPTVVDRDRTPLTEEDGKPYSGCYVNAIVELWAQDNANGKRINASLCGVQFVKDGDSFGGGSAPASEDEFADMSAEGDDNLLD